MICLYKFFKFKQLAKRELDAKGRILSVNSGQREIAIGVVDFPVAFVSSMPGQVDLARQVIH